MMRFLLALVILLAVIAAEPVTADMPETTAIVMLSAEYIGRGGLVALPDALVSVDDLDTSPRTRYTGMTNQQGEWSVKVPIGHTYTWSVDPPLAFGYRKCRLASFNAGWFKSSSSGFSYETIWYGLCTNKKGL